jgi:tRNA (guanine-N7-)-methyltransferase
MGARHRRHANPFAFRQDVTCPDFVALYQRIAPLEVEIGFGKGQFLLALAAARPEVNLLGLEIREFLVEKLLKDAKARGLSNLHAIQCNANTALTALLRPGEVSRFYVHFPDPWFKKRHTKRRVVNSDTAALMRTLLRDGGEIHAMTDFEPIALDMLQCLEAAGFENSSGRYALAPDSTTGYRSEREDWHLSQGDPVYRMLFTKPAAA